VAEPNAGSRPALQAWVIYAVVAAVAIAGFFVLLAIQHAGDHPKGDQAAQSGPADLSAGRPAPDFAATTFDGRPLSLSGLKGKVVLVNFFASWCTECRLEFPDIESVYRAKRDAGFEVVGVNTWEHADGRAFYNELGADFPAVPDPIVGGRGPAPIAHAYGIDTEALPVTVFVARDGTIHQAFPGRIDANIIRAQLAQMGIS
jgi:peroxiredoxin